jgi:hypothetical protein
MGLSVTHFDILYIWITFHGIERDTFRHSLYLDNVPCQDQYVFDDTLGGNESIWLYSTGSFTGVSKIGINIPDCEAICGE